MTRLPASPGGRKLHQTKAKAIRKTGGDADCEARLAAVRIPSAPAQGSHRKTGGSDNRTGAVRGRRAGPATRAVHSAACIPDFHARRFSRCQNHGFGRSDLVTSIRRDGITTSVRQVAKANP